MSSDVCSDLMYVEQLQLINQFTIFSKDTSEKNYIMPMETL